MIRGKTDSMKSYIFIILLSFIFFTTNTFSITPDEAILEINKKLSAIDTMKGQVNIVYQSGETYSGNFMYMNPGKIYIKFSEPPGKCIISDGKVLWIYDPAIDVCGIQDLDFEDKEPMSENTNSGSKKTGKAKFSGGLENLLNSYQIISAADDASALTVDMRNESRKYSELKIIFGLSTLSVKLIFSTKDGDGYSIKLSDIKTGERIIPGVFNFNVPANAQVVKNPLDIR